MVQFCSPSLPTQCPVTFKNPCILIFSLAKTGKNWKMRAEHSNKICSFWLVLWALFKSFDMFARVARCYYKAFAHSHICGTTLQTHQHLLHLCQSCKVKFLWNFNGRNTTDFNKVQISLLRDTHCMTVNQERVEK